MRNRVLIPLAALIAVIIATGALLLTSKPPAPGREARLQATVGQLQFEENFITPPQPIVNTTGGTVHNPQARNYGQSNTYFNNKGKCFGYWNVGGSLDGVTNFATLLLPPPSGCVCPTSTGKCAFEAIANGGPHYATNELGQTTYESMAFYAPPAGLTISNGGGMLEIQELHFANLLNGAPIRFGLHSDHVTVFLDVGQCVQNSYCTYHSNADAPGTHPANSKLLPGLYAIPPGGVVNGRWNEIICAVDWEMTATGSVTCFYRSADPVTATYSAWQQSGVTAGTGWPLGGIPTVQYASGGQPPKTWNDGPEAYGPAVQTQTAIDLTGYSDGTGFSAAVGALP